ncbi:hypothetical protein PsYK624_038510 [Phanerochaete sordida]|uniref:Uncharacterized protein n=1 Tax=Phanerochaete sordida TaxID=48140 RepID=A0A9P3G2E3_9APHY|nr:hypothetical protein PsYK624_038510 [Phanerochaete sordida]
MIMTSSQHNDLDAEKQRYASELAAYTRRQWDTARRSLELNQSPQQAQSNGAARSASDAQTSSTRGSQGIQSHDYAQRSHRRGGSIAHENRAVAA